MTSGEVRIRRAEERDLETLGRLGAALARRHVGFDARRFSVREPAEPVFRAFFANELSNERAAVLLAEAGGLPVGYAFVRQEEASLEDLRGPGAWLHDIYIEESWQGRGVGRALLAAAREAAKALGSDHLMLSVSPHNETGRRLFARAGFRPTMVEMRLELDGPPEDLRDE